jgi:hypothetical protein
MSERTFRAVVAAVLIGALALAVVATAVVLTAQPKSLSSPIVVPTASASVVPTATPTPVAGPVFEAPQVISVGLVARGTSSKLTLVLRFVEPSIAAIPNAPGSFEVTLTDAANDGSTIAFVGTPTINAPGSLGIDARLSAPNVLRVSIVASDTFNIEPITISGLGIRATATAAIGPLDARLSDFTGSLAGGVVSNILPSPGSVTGQ